MSQLITLIGPNYFLLKQNLDKLTTEFINKHGKLAVEKVDAEEVTTDELIDSVRNISLLEPNKLVIIKNIQNNKELTTQLDNLLDNVPENNKIIFVISKPDKRATYYKLLKQKTDMQEFSEAVSADTPNWIIEEVSSRGGDISRKNANLLAQRIGTNQNLLSNEIDKLLCYDKNITQESIELLCDPLPQSSIFELLDTAFSGDSKKAQLLYEEQRKQRVEPLAILGMIAWQLHIFAIIKTAGNSSAQEIAKNAKLNPFVVRKSMQTAKNISLAKLRELIHEALQLDIKLKSEPIDADSAMRLFLLRLAT